MGSDFGGEVAGFYARYRRGYPPEFVDLLVEASRLGPDDVVLDLGCGTGQLTLPLAGRVRGVLALDPEPDMLSLARRAAADRGAGNIAWMLGAAVHRARPRRRAYRPCCIVMQELLGSATRLAISVS